MSGKAENFIDHLNYAASVIAKNSTSCRGIDIWNAKFDDDESILNVRIALCHSFGIERINEALSKDGRKLTSTFRAYWELVK